MLLTDADIAYISQNYCRLEELCEGRRESPEEVRALTEERRLPRPSYVLPDGTGMFPADYFRLVDEADWREALREQVDELDELEREFSPDYDRSEQLDRPPTRDLIIRAARERYPEL